MQRLSCVLPALGGPGSGAASRSLSSTEAETRADLFHMDTELNFKSAGGKNGKNQTSGKEVFSLWLLFALGALDLNVRASGSRLHAEQQRAK